MHRRLLAALTTSAAFAGIMVGAPAASAEPDPPGCPKGYFCVYSGQHQTGQLVMKTAGNWTGNAVGQSVFNNGYAYPGYDHVQFDWVYTSGTGGNSWCFHYNPGPDIYKNSWTYPISVKQVVWRGEC
jgi:hypothetical protein